MASGVAPFVLALLVVLCSGSGVTPIQKVLQMMDELTAKAVEEKEAEIQTFNEFTRFCKDTIRDKGYAIKDGAAALEQLEADISKYDSDSDVLGEELKKLAVILDDASYEKRRAKEAREKSSADYRETHEDLVGSIEELSVGIAKLKNMMSSTSAASFIQEMASSSRMVTSARRALRAFLQQPEPAAFESQSGGVVDMMKDLEDKLVAQKGDLETEELQANHAYSMLAQGLDQQIKKATEEQSEKSSTKKQKESASAAAKGDLADTTTTKAEDEKYAADLTAICEQKSSDFEARQKMRQEELNAIDKAKEIIGGQAVSGSGDKHLPAASLLLQSTSASSALAQLRSSETRRQTQSAVASFLRRSAAKFDSRILSLLSLRVSADPFVKVRKMIKDMITKLVEEAEDEAEHKGFCDEEMSSNKATRDEKTAKVQELNANIEEMTATSQKLSTDMTTLTEEISQIDAAVAKATTIREAEKAKNAVTIADAKQAIDAVGKAIGVLKEFYAKAAEATALVQRGPADDVPETFDKPFTGSGGEGGILGMLDVILSDFQRLEAETAQTEETNKSEHDTFLADSAEDKETKHKANIDKNRAQIKLNHEIKLTKKELARNQEELSAAMEYYDKLKPSCVDAGVSYEDRVAQRKQEIESLKEALKILEDEA